MNTNNFGCGHAAPGLSTRFLQSAWIGLLALCSWQPLHGQGDPVASPAAGNFLERGRTNFEAVLRLHGSPRNHFEGTPQEELRRLARASGQYHTLFTEKIQAKWFAALVAEEPERAHSILKTFPTWGSLVEFLENSQALVEVHTYSANGQSGRRLTALELAEWQRKEQKEPTSIRLVYLDADRNDLMTNRLEFSFNAASQASGAQRGYRRHRQLQLAARKALGARDSANRLNALTQWEALNRAVDAGELNLQPMPERPKDPADLFVALEFEVDSESNYLRLVRVFKESEIQQRIVRDQDGRDQPILVLRRAGEQKGEQARAYQVKGVSDELVPAPHPIAGQEQVQLRIVDPLEPQIQRWHVLEFGEPEIIKQSALSRFSLISAYLERSRKRVAVAKADLDRIVEPLIAALNIGGGASGVGFPIGDAARLLYNLASLKYIAPVPSAGELRELFALMAARNEHRAYRLKPAKYLSREDLAELRELGRALPDAVVQEYLETISDQDVEAMLWLARMRMIDARVTTFLNILTGVGKVSGLSEAGILRDIFNNPYFSVNGDISLKTLLAVAVGQKVTTPLSGVALRTLIEGNGPALAWLQFFDMTVDLRALVNTVARWSKPSLARKELDKPFPYALRASDLAAYEFRIFGFPLLLFYKRGLIRADYKAYENDYAYGLLGAKLVEHFKTKEEMDQEIRAGRMAPLGYVRVPDGKGHWKETNLAVFAHRIPFGRYRGKTAIIIYGLKAYHEHSEAIERELSRFRKYEAALEQGGVIEQWVEAEDRETLSAAEFEPQLEVGPAVAEEKFTAWLARLLELRRFWQQKAWGVAIPGPELDAAADILEWFAAKGIWLEDRNPLLGVDKFNSSFLYREGGKGKNRVKKVTLLPSMKEVTRQLQQAELAEKIGEVRRESLSPGGQGVVLLNEAIEYNGRYEVGPLLTGDGGQVLGSGVIHGPASLPRIFELIDRLPVTDRARLVFNKFAATLVELDWKGSGKPTRVFLTIEFPPDRFERDWLNPLSGATERRTYEDRLWRRTVTDRWIMALEYDQWDVEKGSKTYTNQGTREQPVQGMLIEETRTLEWWARDGNLPGLDPYLPFISKLKINYLTGVISREIYGLFPLPVRTIDDQSITDNRFNTHGILAAAAVVDNGKSESDFQRPPEVRLLEPIEGVPRFHLVSSHNDIDQVWTLASDNFQWKLNQVDLIRNLKKTITFDNQRFGRKVSETFVDLIDPDNPVTLTLTNRYRDGFFLGLIPWESTIQSAPGAILSQMATVEYDPAERRLVGVVTDYTGNVTTNIWDYRWQSPVEVRSPGRQAWHHFNRFETEDAGWIVENQNGERLADFSARYQTNSITWKVQQTNWHRPGILLRTESNTFSAFGKLITSRVNDIFEIRPAYDLEGREVSRDIWIRDPGTGEFTLRSHGEADYQWASGNRDARMQTYLGNKAYDSFRRVTDSAGRTLSDGVRKVAGLDLKTLLAYDGGSDRVTTSELFQNNQVRERRQAVFEERQSDGTHHLKVRITLSWGLVSTQTFLIGDVRGRPLGTLYENGVSSASLEWIEQTAIARVVIERNRQGRIIKKHVHMPGYDQEADIAYDLSIQSPVNYWGEPGSAEEIAFIRGTDIPFFKRAPPEKIYYDLTSLHPAPSYAVGLDPGQGIIFNFGQTNHPSVTAVFLTHPPDRTRSAQPGPAASTLMVDRADFRGLFFHEIRRQTLDRAGHILQEQISRVPNPGQKGYSRDWLVDAVSRSQPDKRFVYLYAPGWLVEKIDPLTGHRLRVLTTNSPEANLRAEWINSQGPEVITEVRGTQELTKEDLDYTHLQDYFFQRMHSPRQWERNPYFPERSDVWTAWTRTELQPNGRPFFSSEIVLDAQGRTVLAKARKSTEANGEGHKISYWLFPPAADQFKSYIVDTPSNLIVLPASALSQTQRADYFYFFLRDSSHSVQRVVVEDKTGRKVSITRGNHEDAWAPVALGSANVHWFPNETTPKLGVAITSGTSGQDEQPVVIPGYGLSQGGLDIGQIKSISLLAQGPAAAQIQVSPVYYLATGEKFHQSPRPPPGFAAALKHRSGIQILSQPKAFQSAPLPENLPQTRALLEWNGLPFGKTRARSRHSGFGELVIMDNSELDSPRPLYALTLREGYFLERYLTRKWGEARVYTIVSGFETPKFERYRPDRLSDETSPGGLAYGYDYPVQIRLAKGNGPVGKRLATLENRISANAFKLGGERLGTFLRSGTLQDERTSHLNYAELHNARKQADAVNHLPLLAEAILANTISPWNSPEPGNPLSELASAPPLKPRYSRRAVALQLLELHALKNPLPATGLIPTSLGSEIERYADTVDEAELILLSVKLEEYGLAKDLLDFYWKKFQEDAGPLHATYDASAGTAMSQTSLYRRPQVAARTADAQLAIAEAAFALGSRTGEFRWIRFGQDLLSIVLDEFRPKPSGTDPRGIAEHKVSYPTPANNPVFWPVPQRYSLGSNARAYLLLARIKSKLLEDYFVNPAWKAEADLALLEQAEWLKTFIIPHADRTGLLPKGLFEIQETQQKQTALAAERWTSADDWLSFLEAAHTLGLSRKTLQGWLENLARVHGVQLRDAWGLAPSIPLLSPDAISPKLTAKFYRVALLLEHTNAAHFARRNLELVSQDGKWPVLYAPGIQPLPYQTGQGQDWYPVVNRWHSLRRENDLLGPWPQSLTIYNELEVFDWKRAALFPPRAGPPELIAERPQPDLTIFLIITLGFYLAILVVALFWWQFRRLRRNQPAGASTTPATLGVAEPLVPEPVMERAEERWAKRVLGLQEATGADRTRYSNAPVEMNFQMQFRAIYKLVLEWRRQENDWALDDPRLVEDESDDWLNGMDAFASVAGIYMRSVIKAGAKDGFEQSDPMAGNEDSNHIWSRLVMYFSEYYWGLLGLMRDYNNLVTYQDKAKLYGQITELLAAMGVAPREEGFDARKLFNYPANPGAFDLLVIQKPGATLRNVMTEAAAKLKIPAAQIESFIAQYKSFKKRENPYPIHPYVIEFAKLIPHFFLMGLGSLVYYNQSIGDRPIVSYLWSVLTGLFRSADSLIWAIPLTGALFCHLLSHFARIYRYDAPMLPRGRVSLILDATLTSLFATKHSAIPRLKTEPWWNPAIYEWTGWTLRAIGYLALATQLFTLEVSSFATFLVIKGLFAMLVLAEMAAMAGPLLSTLLSKWWQDLATARLKPDSLLGFANRLNITATRPASPLWLSIKYHFQPSVPSGDFAALLQAIVFYFVLGASFFFIGGYICQQIFSLWFTEKYLHALDWRLFLGGVLFWNTMYLLRYGLFLLASGIASAFAAFPLKMSLLTLALAQIWLASAKNQSIGPVSEHPAALWALTLLALGIIAFESKILAWFKKRRAGFHRPKSKPTSPSTEPNQNHPGNVLGVVYMSGDDLSHLKLTTAVLMARWRILRDQLDSEGVRWLFGMLQQPSDELLEQRFEKLYTLEKQFKVTLWHPSQLHVERQAPGFAPGLGLNIPVATVEDRQELLAAWHVRRWLVTMMSTAGHAQDTAINLVDIALQLNGAGLAGRTAFYLIQNKYDNNDNNRPSQSNYLEGELGHRNKLAHLLMAMAPGARAYSLHNWTPFGFKAGGLTAMDLVPEEILKLGTMLLLDRNATIHDLDALMVDLNEALNDPDMVIVIPGRSTTNTRTPIGQASQLVEEGHRSFLRGLMTLLGGRASESVGTGWGNILAVFYGRVQRAMTDFATPKMPLTSRMRRGSSFAVRTEGLIGFTPHAVGISEDTWAVSQAAHNAIALGQRVKFRLSTALWHKIRETWSHSEWLASFPRWSGGYIQMMHDPLMQRINDFGPLSIFAKEVRANSGRVYLTAIFALASVLLMPLAIILDLTPFVQILVVLWNFGFVMNQVLTVHGLLTYLEGSGFYPGPACLGAAAAAALVALNPSLAPLASGLVVLGFLGGGFLTGLSRWLYTRLRDILLFGPQLILHALGQFVRQSLEFVTSGASPEDAKGVNVAFRSWVGPREDRPHEPFPNLINLRTVVWGVGLFSFILNIFALANLDMLNALLLLPSLLFSVSALVGPFLAAPKKGKSLGAWTVLPRLLGWLSGLSFYILISVFISKGQDHKGLGVILCLAVFAAVVHRALRHHSYKLKLAESHERLARILRNEGLPAIEAKKMAGQIIGQATGDLKKLESGLKLASVSASARQTIFDHLQNEVIPLNRSVASGAAPGDARARFICELGRSFVLSLFVLVWFLIVPLPALFVFTAGAYQGSVELRTIVLAITAGVVLTLIGFWIGQFIEWAAHRSSTRFGLKSEVIQLFEAFQARLRSAHPFSAQEISQVYALFTDLKTYVDQRSYAYARQTFQQLQQIIGREPETKTHPG